MYRDNEVLLAFVLEYMWDDSAKALKVIEHGNLYSSNLPRQVEPYQIVWQEALEQIHRPIRQYLANKNEELGRLDTPEDNYKKNSYYYCAPSESQEQQSPSISIQQLCHLNDIKLVNSPRPIFMSLQDKSILYYHLQSTGMKNYLPSTWFATKTTLEKVKATLKDDKHYVVKPCNSCRGEGVLFITKNEMSWETISDDPSYLSEDTPYDPVFIIQELVEDTLARTSEHIRPTRRVIVTVAGSANNPSVEIHYPTYHTQQNDVTGSTRVIANCRYHKLSLSPVETKELKKYVKHYVQSFYPEKIAPINQWERMVNELLLRPDIPRHLKIIKLRLLCHIMTHTQRISHQRLQLITIEKLEEVFEYLNSEERIYVLDGYFNLLQYHLIAHTGENFKGIDVVQPLLYNLLLMVTEFSSTYAPERLDLFFEVVCQAITQAKTHFTDGTGSQHLADLYHIYGIVYRALNQANNTDNTPRDISPSALETLESYLQSSEHNPTTIVENLPQLRDTNLESEKFLHEAMSLCLKYNRADEFFILLGLSSSFRSIDTTLLAILETVYMENNTAYVPIVTLNRIANISYCMQHNRDVMLSPAIYDVILALLKITSSPGLKFYACNLLLRAVRMQVNVLLYDDCSNISPTEYAPLFIILENLLAILPILYKNVFSDYFGHLITSLTSINLRSLQTLSNKERVSLMGRCQYSALMYISLRIKHALDGAEKQCHRDEAAKFTRTSFSELLTKSPLYDSCLRFFRGQAPTVTPEVALRRCAAGLSNGTSTAGPSHMLILLLSGAIADLNAKSPKTGDTACHLAAKRSQELQFCLLLIFGASLETTNKEEKSVIDIIDALDKPTFKSLIPPSLRR